MSDVESQKRARRTHTITVWVAPIAGGILAAIIGPILLGYFQRPAAARLEADVQENYFAYPPLHSAEQNLALLTLAQNLFPDRSHFLWTIFLTTFPSIFFLGRQGYLLTVTRYS